MAKKAEEKTEEVQPAHDALKAQYEEVLAEATAQFEFVSRSGDKALISKAAQKVADIKQRELDRLAGNLP